MSYIYSQEQGEAYWRAINSDIQSSEQSSGNHTVRSYCKQDNKTEHSHPSLSGETLEHSTGDPGVDAWILSARASRVSRSQSRETSELVKIQEMGGPPPFESFGKFDQSGCCLRTYQVSLLDPMGTCTPYSDSWPRAGMIVDGTAYLRTPVAHLTRETGSGLWPTPTATEVRQGYQNRTRGKKGNQISLSTAVINSLGGREATAGHLNPEWTEWLMGWPIGWTDLKPLAMDKFQAWQSKHGDC